MTSGASGDNQLASLQDGIDRAGITFMTGAVILMGVGSVLATPAHIRQGTPANKLIARGATCFVCSGISGSNQGQP